jgi:hypothetical protein
MKITVLLAGAGFRPESAKEVLRRATPGDRFTLEPDPENEYDSNAVRVMHEGQHVGFIPRDSNEDISAHLLHGDELFAEVIAFESSLRPILEIEL